MKKNLGNSTILSYKIFEKQEREFVNTLQSCTTSYIFQIEFKEDRINFQDTSCEFDFYGKMKKAMFEK